MRKKLSIVFEETSNHEGTSFNCYVSGFDRDISHLKDEELTPAEYWCATMFTLVGSALQDAGVVKNVRTQAPPLKKDVH
jgi:hypothetical protein